jgi:peptidoglycan/LPS O-acetylase OafA/YrhL
MALNSVDSFGFAHLWTLSIEEQYYLVWPALLVLMLRRRLSLRVAAASTVALAVLSACIPWIISDATWRRLYYGADYRAHGLLIGSAAGILFAGGVLRREHVRHPLALVALAAGVAYVAWIMLFSSDRAGFLFSFGYPAVAGASALIVVSLAFVDGGWPLRMFGNGAITYLGRRSYAVYLWHMPIGQWTRALDTAEQFVVAGALTLLAAELSHRLVEAPALSLKRRYATQESGAEAPEVTDDRPQQRAAA